MGLDPVTASGKKCYITDDKMTQYYRIIFFSFNLTENLLKNKKDKKVEKIDEVVIILIAVPLKL